MMDPAVEKQVLAANVFRMVGTDFVTPTTRRNRYHTEFHRIGEALWVYGSPFRGLESFGFEHAAVYFGRTRAVAALLDALRRQAAARRAFVLVVGMSGGGKSSLARAGVMPMLTQPFKSST